MNHFTKMASAIVAGLMILLVTSGTATARPCANCTPEPPPCGRACQP